MSKLLSPTGTHAKAYLATAWTNRDQLSSSERRGLSQFLYIVAFSHLENVISQIIRARLSTIKYYIVPEQVAPVEYKQPDSTETVPLSAAHDSIKHLLSSIERESESAPLNVAANLFSKLFASGISKYIGSDLNHDLEAIKDLRNLFAHGKDIIIRFEGSLEDGYFAKSEDTVLHKPLSRLKAAGIIEKIEITGRSHVEYSDLLYSDVAMEYFYKAVSNIEERLIESCLLAHERGWAHVSKLPAIFS